jgi:hypothetical protein
MATEGRVDYESVLADLRARRDQLDAAISAIEAMLGISTDDTIASVARVMESKEIKDDTFLGMSVPAATRKYLLMMKRPQSTQEIADALRRGGIHSTAKHFSTTIYTALSRQEDVVRLGKKWSMKEWHPGIRTKKQGNGADPDAGEPASGGGSSSPSST